MMLTSDEISNIIQEITGIDYKENLRRINESIPSIEDFLGILESDMGVAKKPHHARKQRGFNGYNR